ncbi:hypothetical protein GCM10010269_01140 [Streptomyces humidus]|uniref:Uncharacterized protein n=1 Tax=Streptomyces humidus TaxID=52259 RepID=A0A918FQ15_9ACTN|nr:hypothetical protein GCM10010269_01140 [Streptomyces humidus]
MRYDRTVSGCTLMCAAISLYDQSLRSVMSCTSVRARAAAGRPPGGAGAALAITKPVPNERRPVTVRKRLSTDGDREPAYT